MSRSSSNPSPSNSDTTVLDPSVTAVTYPPAPAVTAEPDTAEPATPEPATAEPDTAEPATAGACWAGHPDASPVCAVHCLVDSSAPVACSITRTRSTAVCPSTSDCQDTSVAAPATAATVFTSPA